MASSDDFKAQLKAGNIPEALALALSEAVELKFTTWVPTEEDVDTSVAKPGHRLRTRINMIEGEVEHEVGEEFIGNGRYRELKQFHLEQVAGGSQLIENNLKSLQKLFEVLVALHYPDTTLPLIEPESLDRESQLLPSAEEIPEAKPVVEPTEGVTDAIITPDLVTQEDIIPEPSSASELPISSLTPSTENDPILVEEADEEEDEDDDWDDSVLDLLESLPVAPPPNSDTPESDLRENWEWTDTVEAESETEPEASNLPVHQDWENLRPEDLASPSEAQPQNLESDSFPVEQDLREFVAEQSEFEPEESDSLETQHWENLISRDDVAPFPTSESQNLETSISPVDEDWGDFMEEEPESAQGELNSLENQDWATLKREDFASPSTSEQDNLEARSPMDEDWGDFVDHEADTELDKPVPNLESLDLEEDEEWDDWVMDEPPSLIEAPVVDMESLELVEDEDWGDLVEDTEPFANSSLDELSSNLEASQDWDDFMAEELEPSGVLLDRDHDIGTGFDWSGTLDDLTPDESQTNNLNLNNNQFSPDSEGSQASEPGVSPELSDKLTDQEPDAGTQPKSVDKQVPPPPPPNSNS
ncbi:hypothetical protein [Allocoleopsis franciscana]|uniref:Uncharacterized protein n=1 Tax=Allocoleopsis franciscana PCC 7113 TaxID=1173027 RepID=K9WJB2_9CYAN|nr:hypothetical protein [Allocoleopsis franciscana]AFZ19869.1 hypothetical protein Mic7113_4168 [Allocoleopsis franciscana PCC 7113]